MKNILLVTRPIAPPWDEASKNFAYYLAQNIKVFDFFLLTNGLISGLNQNVHQKPIYTSNDFSYLQKIRLIRHLRKMRNDFDVLHYVFTPTKQNTFLIKNIVRNQKARTIQTIATLREDLFSTDELREIIFGDLVITYSDHAKNKLLEIGTPNVVRIYPGIDLQQYQLTPKDLGAMDHFKISKDDFVVLYPGEYTRLGATDDYVAALPELFNKIPNCKFVFACRVKNEKDAAKKLEVAAKLESLGILDKVIFTDTFSDMPKLYNLADVVVFTVRDMKGKFDVPLAVIEAMACKKPVIISNLPILKEFAKENNSVIIEAGNGSHLIESIEKLKNDPDFYSNICENARKYVEDNFDINSVAKQYETAYNKLLRNNQETSNK